MIKIYILITLIISLIYEFNFLTNDLLLTHTYIIKTIYMVIMKGNMVLKLRNYGNYLITR